MITPWERIARILSTAKRRFRPLEQQLSTCITRLPKELKHLLFLQIFVPFVLFDGIHLLLHVASHALAPSFFLPVTIVNITLFALYQIAHFYVWVNAQRYSYLCISACLANGICFLLLGAFSLPDSIPHLPLLLSIYG